jgi:hypothetical protein
MKTNVPLTSALLLGLSLIVSEAAALQKCKEGECAPCVVGGKKGTRCCDNGRLSACIPEVSQEGALCGGKVCGKGKVCQDRQCVSSCKQGFTDCDGFCLNLSFDSTNCGACNNVCPSGTSCQPTAPVVFSPKPGEQSPPVGGSACTCIPPPSGAETFAGTLEMTRRTAGLAATFVAHPIRLVGTASAYPRRPHQALRRRGARETCRLTSSGLRPIPMDCPSSRIGVLAPTPRLSTPTTLIWVKRVPPVYLMPNVWRPVLVVRLGATLVSLLQHAGSAAPHSR